MSAPMPRKATPVTRLLGHLLVMNMRRWLPIKPASDNKIAVCFDALMASPLVKKPKALTLTGRADGMGAQLHGQLSLIALARMHGIPYAHRDIRQAEHTTGPEDIARWNAAFNFAAAADCESAEAEHVVPMGDYVLWPFGRNSQSIVGSRHVHRAAERHARDYAEICADLRRALAFAKPTACLPAHPLRVAVHIRRGDAQEGKNAKRLTTLETTKRTLSDLTRCLDEQDLAFELELHSQGDSADFKPLLDTHTMSLYLDTDPLVTMQRLIEADVLITARSSFSQLAAMMSEGEIIHQSFWHKPLPHWLTTQANGAVDRGQLEDMADRLKRRQSNPEQI